MRATDMLSLTTEGRWMLSMKIWSCPSILPRRRRQKNSDFEHPNVAVVCIMYSEQLHGKALSKNRFSKEKKKRPCLGFVLSSTLRWFPHWNWTSSWWICGEEIGQSTDQNLDQLTICGKPISEVVVRGGGVRSWPQSKGTNPNSRSAEYDPKNPSSYA